jgi:cytochrome c oxidase cbb3-type subunit 4
MDINLVRSLVTVAALAAFLGIVWWAYAPSRKERFERDALLPFDGDEE